ncbi:MAG: hypothetical protein WA634_13645 [Silvibacterium sp.]
MIRSIRSLACVAAWILSLSFLTATGVAQKLEKIPLDNGWQFRQYVTDGGNGEIAPDAEWQPDAVPGDIHLDRCATN